MKVLVRGGISVYEPSGNYQLYAKEMQPDGVGALYLAYEELKRSLPEKVYLTTATKNKSPHFQPQSGL